MRRRPSFAACAPSLEVQMKSVFQSGAAPGLVADVLGREDAAEELARRR